MVEPVSTTVGGIIGAIIGLFWSDPFRNKKGQFTTRQSGFESWILQAIVGAFAGAAITTLVLPALFGNPILGLTVLAGITYFCYMKFVDPR